ncbi:MAG TPA: hypothetical protein PLD55_08465 [bacterium]|nr:hypothetical protein [bacterium]HPM46897.1 hypothetical protein [bacterium]HQM84696.1 hypothetical protein [bacterium]
MKRFFSASVFILFPFFVFSQAWECTDADDCSAGMTCHEELCIAPSANFSTYAAVTLKTGDNTPNSLGSKKIFVAHPAKDVVLGQLGIDSYAGGAEGKLYLFKELTVTVVSSSLDIKGTNFRLVYDNNGNGLFDSSEKVIATVESPEGSTVKFQIGQKTASYKMNVTENFLVVGDFSIDKELTSLWDFGVDIKPSTGISISTAGGTGSVEIAAYPEKISFPRFSFEPESGYFLFASGKYFPKAPSWKEMNKTQTIMHIRTKALDGENEIKSINIRLDGTIVSFGNGVKKISLSLDNGNKGKADSLIEEKTDFVTPVQNVQFQMPSGTLSMEEGEEKFLVVTAELDFYNGQTTQFYITANDVILSKNQQIAGATVITEQFKYSCDETDSECKKAPGNEPEEEDESTGCTVIYVD